jgi:hypothetical protein
VSRYPRHATITAITVIAPSQRNPAGYTVALEWAHSGTKGRDIMATRRYRLDAEEIADQLRAKYGFTDLATPANVYPQTQHHTQQAPSGVVIRRSAA